MSSYQAELQKLIVEAVSNDYEDFDTVLSQVQSWTLAQQSAPGADIVEKLLIELVSVGAIEAYSISPSVAQFVPTEATPAVVRSLWFYVTQKGKERLGELE